MEKELVFLKNKQAVTDSRIVADYFDRTHNEVLKSIRRLKNDIGGLVKNPQTPMFIETTYINEQNGQSYPMFYMNRDTAFLSLLWASLARRLSSSNSLSSPLSTLWSNHLLLSLQIKFPNRFPSTFIPFLVLNAVRNSLNLPNPLATLS